MLLSIQCVSYVYRDDDDKDDEDDDDDFGYSVSTTDNILILGDLNAYAQETPVRTLVDAGFVDAADQFLGDDAYSFVFDGQTGTLDYALASGAMAAALTGATEWHINADEADAIDYNLDFGRPADLFNGDTPARNSDHDPVIIGLDIDALGHDDDDDYDDDDAPLMLVEGVQTYRKVEWVRGSESDDLIVGKGGRNDKLIGDEGEDCFYFGSETFNGKKDKDVIHDFNSDEDCIVIANENYEVVKLLEDRAVIKVYGKKTDKIVVKGEFESEEDLNITVGTYDLSDYTSMI